MTSEQYVELVKQMMNQQNIFFSIFLAILAIILAFVGVIQWRLSSKQIELIKQETKKELEKEIAEKLGVSGISEFPEVSRKESESIVQYAVSRIEKLDEVFDEFALNYWRTEDFRYRIALIEIGTAIGNEMSSYRYILDIYSPVMLRNVGSFNFYINNLSNWISVNEEKAQTEEYKYQILRVVESLGVIEEKLEDSTHSGLNNLRTKLSILAITEK